MLYLNQPKKTLLIDEKPVMTSSFVSCSFTNYGESVYYDEASKTVKKAGSFCATDIPKKYQKDINPLEKVFESLELVELNDNDEIIGRHKLLGKNDEK